MLNIYIDKLHIDKLITCAKISCTKYFYIYLMVINIMNSNNLLVSRYGVVYEQRNKSEAH